MDVHTGFTSAVIVTVPRSETSAGPPQTCNRGPRHELERDSAVKAVCQRGFRDLEGDEKKQTAGTLSAPHVSLVVTRVRAGRGAPSCLDPCHPGMQGPAQGSNGRCTRLRAPDPWGVGLGERGWVPHRRRPVEASAGTRWPLVSGKPKAVPCATMSHVPPQ